MPAAGVPSLHTAHRLTNVLAFAQILRVLTNKILRVLIPGDEILMAVKHRRADRTVNTHASHNLHPVPLPVIDIILPPGLWPWVRLSL